MHAGTGTLEAVCSQRQCRQIVTIDGLQNFLQRATASGDVVANQLALELRVAVDQDAQGLQINRRTIHISSSKGNGQRRNGFRRNVRSKRRSHWRSLQRFEGTAMLVNLRRLVRCASE